jgi:Clp amino terminal domain, pathogenicity island component
MEPDPPGPVQAMVAAVAGGTLGVPDVAAWLAPRLRQAGAAPGVKEAPMRRSLPFARKTQGKFRRFTDRARRVVYLASEEARRLGHQHVGPGHLLLGLIEEGDGVAALVLESLGVSLDELRGRVEEAIGRGQGSPRHIPLTPSAKAVLEGALREALKLGHNFIGTEHLLLSLARADEGDDVAVRLLAGAGVTYDRVLEHVAAFLPARSGGPTRLVRLAVPPDLAHVEERLAEARRQRAAAAKAGDLGRTAALRDQVRQLRLERLRLDHEWRAGVAGSAFLAENERLHRELDRLRGLLREHGIDPDGGTAQTA